MFFLRPPEAASKRTRVCFFGGFAAEKTHILFCSRYLTTCQYCAKQSEFNAKMGQFFKTLFIFPVRIYQWIISPLFPPSCRFQPSCSHYTVEAIQEWGPLKGLWMGLKRLSRCHPWSEGGEDPVPLYSKHNHATK